MSDAWDINENTASPSNRPERDRGRGRRDEDPTHDADERTDGTSGAA